ncbi:helix-turn-helix domain-containing protein [Glutamicibacter mysorens]
MTVKQAGRPLKSNPVTNTNERIGLTLRTLRVCHGITGDEMAAALKISAPLYYHYEAGRRPIPWERLQRAAWAIDCRSQIDIRPESIALPSECGGAALTVVEGVAA